MREHLFHQGAKGVYRKEWVGIRPSGQVVYKVSPISLEVTALDAGRILYFGRCVQMFTGAATGDSSVQSRSSSPGSIDPKVKV